MTRDISLAEASVQVLLSDATCGFACAAQMPSAAVRCFQVKTRGYTAETVADLIRWRAGKRLKIGPDFDGGNSDWAEFWHEYDEAQWRVGELSRWIYQPIRMKKMMARALWSECGGNRECLLELVHENLGACEGVNDATELGDEIAEVRDLALPTRAGIRKGLLGALEELNMSPAYQSADFIRVDRKCGPKPVQFGMSIGPAGDDRQLRLFLNLAPGTEKGDFLPLFHFNFSEVHHCVLDLIVRATAADLIGPLTVFFDAANQILDEQVFKWADSAFGKERKRRNDKEIYG